MKTHSKTTKRMQWVFIALGFEMLALVLGLFAFFQSSLKTKIEEALQMEISIVALISGGFLIWSLSLGVKIYYFQSALNAERKNESDADFS